jgi:hypothetical protein
MSKPTKDEVYRRAHQLTLDLYESIPVNPDREDFDLAQEIRHAAFSLSMALSPHVHREDAIDAARDARARLECLLILARDLSYFPEADLADFEKRTKEIGNALEKLRPARGPEE